MMTVVSFVSAILIGALFCLTFDSVFYHLVYMYDTQITKYKLLLLDFVSLVVMMTFWFVIGTGLWSIIERIT